MRSLILAAALGWWVCYEAQQRPAAPSCSVSAEDRAWIDVAWRVAL